MERDYQTITVERERHIARIVLDRPERLNAISLTMQSEINDACWALDADTSVHVVIIKGRGRAFSSGYDLAEQGEDSQGTTTVRGTTNIDDDTWHLERAQSLRMAIFDMHKPVIAQVHGYCLAGAMDYAMLCDIVIAASDSQFGFPATRSVGTVPNQMWLYQCGPQWTKRLLFTGDLISGEDAAKMGLVLKAVAPGLLEREVEGLANRISLVDPASLAVNKRVVNLALELMGARTLQRLAAENDARGHASGGYSDFRELIRTKGLRHAVMERDAPFGDSVARFDRPEIRDADGRLLE